MFRALANSYIPFFSDGETIILSLCVFGFSAGFLPRGNFSPPFSYYYFQYFHNCTTFYKFCQVSFSKRTEELSLPSVLVECSVDIFCRFLSVQDVKIYAFCC